jgi:hypothetical protein
MVWTGSNWLRIGTSGGLLWTRWWIFGFLKIAGNFLNGCTIGSFWGRAQVRKWVFLIVPALIVRSLTSLQPVMPLRLPHPSPTVTLDPQATGQQRDRVRDARVRWVSDFATRVTVSLCLFPVVTWDIVEVWWLQKTSETATQHTSEPIPFKRRQRRGMRLWQ